MRAIGQASAWAYRVQSFLADRENGKETPGVDARVLFEGYGTVQLPSTDDILVLAKGLPNAAIRLGKRGPKLSRLQPSSGDMCRFRR